MIIDSSAIMAIFLKEDDAALFAKIISETPETKRISTGNYLELTILIDSQRDPILSRQFDEFMRLSNISIQDFTVSQVKIAREAYRDFGKGSGSSARLNFGDCFAYALAKDTGEALLFKGNDFTQTDIKSAV